MEECAVKLDTVTSLRRLPKKRGLGTEVILGRYGETPDDLTGITSEV